MADEILAGAAGAAQRDAVGFVGDQGAQAGPVGAQGVGEHERVEAVVLVARRAVPAAQVLDPVRADHDDRDLGVEQGLDDRAVGSFDRDLTGAVPGQEPGQLAQAGAGVLDHRSGDLAAAAIEDAHGVVVAGPVDPGGDVARWGFGQGGGG